MLDYLGQFHPLVLHLPIGILVIGVLLIFWFKKKPSDQSEEITKFVFKVAFASAFFSCITGYFLKESGGYGEELVDRHQWSAIALTVLTGVYAFFAIAEKYVYPYLGVTMLVLTFTGHQGGSLTHGEDFLSFSSKVEKQAITDVEQALVYEDIIKPILEEKCYQCHSSRKQKGELRLDSPEAILAGGEKGKVLAHGDIDKSSLYTRLMLPESNEEHMPPKGKPQPTEEEVKLLKWWIAQGGDFEKMVSEIEERSGVEKALVNLESPEEEEEIAIPLIPSEEIAAISPELFDELKNIGASVVPVSQTSNYLSITFLANPKIGCDAMAVLQKVKDNIVWLELNQAQVGDACLKGLADFENLITLDLSGTQVSDEGLKVLASLKKLQRLYLVNTKVTNAGLNSLSDLTELQRLYLFQSQVNFSDWQVLRATFPTAEIDTGGYQLPFLETDTVMVSYN